MDYSVLSPLSPRQHQVLQMLANGAVMTEIAQSMGVHYGVAKVHCMQARHKMKARTNSQAVAEALRKGYIT